MLTCYCCFFSRLFLFVIWSPFERFSGMKARPTSDLFGNPSVSVLQVLMFPGLLFQFLWFLSEGLPPFPVMTGSTDSPGPTTPTSTQVTSLKPFPSKSDTPNSHLHVCPSPSTLISLKKPSNRIFSSSFHYSSSLTFSYLY